MLCREGEHIYTLISGLNGWRIVVTLEITPWPRPAHSGAVFALLVSHRAWALAAFLQPPRSSAGLGKPPWGFLPRHGWWGNWASSALFYFTPQFHILISPNSTFIKTLCISLVWFFEFGFVPTWHSPHPSKLPLQLQWAPFISSANLTPSYLLCVHTLISFSPSPRTKVLNTQLRCHFLQEDCSAHDWSMAPLSQRSIYSQAIALNWLSSIFKFLYYLLIFLSLGHRIFKDRDHAL